MAGRCKRGSSTSISSLAILLSRAFARPDEIIQTATRVREEQAKIIVWLSRRH